MYPTPITRLHLELSNRCNAQCPSCQRYIMNSPVLNPTLKISELTLADIKKSFPNNSFTPLKDICICGSFGDSLTSKDLIPIVSHFIETFPDIRIELHTNGGLGSSSTWLSLAKIFNTSDRKIMFAIDGLEDTNHIYRRNVNWNTLIANANLFIANGGYACWNFLVFKHNEKQIETAKEYSKSLGFKEFYLKKALGFSYDQENVGVINVKNAKAENIYQIHQTTLEEFAFTPEKISPLLNEKIFVSPTHDNKNMLRYMKKGAIHIDKLSRNPFLLRKLKQTDLQFNPVEINCQSISNREIYINATGEVLPCCFFGSALERLSFENETMQIRALYQQIDIKEINIKNHSLKEILNHKIFAELIPDSWIDNQGVCGKLKTCSIYCNKKEDTYLSKYITSRDFL